MTVSYEAYLAIARSLGIQAQKATAALRRLLSFGPRPAAQGPSPSQRRAAQTARYLSGHPAAAKSRHEHARRRPDPRPAPGRRRRLHHRKVNP